jgi:hypothetical protein
MVSVAPARPYSSRERAAIRRFVENGGLFILTIGYADRVPVMPLLRDFGFAFGDGTAPGRHTPDPTPLGFFKSPYFNAGEYMVYVRFHAAWPIRSEDPEARVVAYGPGDLPVILARRVGAGTFLVVGDSSFPVNKNLEVESGAAFEGMRENPHFWRWLLSTLRDETPWIPPNPLPGTEEAAEPEDIP